MSKSSDVGYRRPPKGHQFKPGKSGNPKGRPKGRLNITSELKRELANQITVRENGQPRKISKRTALLKSLIAKGLGGDVKAISSIVEMVVKLEQQMPAVEEHTVGADEVRILRRFGPRAARTAASKSRRKS